MHAIVIHEGGGPEVLRYEEVPDPEPGDGHVLVKVEAAAVNHYDLGVRANPGGSLSLIPGVDAAGTRVDTGERVLVTGQPGAYAELIAAPADLVRPIPDSLDAATATALGVAGGRWPRAGRHIARPGRLERDGAGRDRHRPPARRDGLRDGRARQGAAPS